jgi:N utilization substance protein B
VTKNWDLRRMATVDRNVLRMAVYELAHCDDVPPKVAINEAIELGKKFSTANSGGFVNGILDRIRIDLERERAAAPPASDAGTAGAATAE